LRRCLKLHYSLSDAKDDYTPDEGIVILQWDNNANPLSSDVCHPVNKYEDADEVGLMPAPAPSVTHYYLHSSGEITDLDGMLSQEYDWIPELEEPDWYDEVA